MSVFRVYFAVTLIAKAYLAGMCNISVLQHNMTMNIHRRSEAGRTQMCLLHKTKLKNLKPLRHLEIFSKKCALFCTVRLVHGIEIGLVTKVVSS